MLLAIILVLSASLMWATTNHIDKYISHKFIGESNIRGLLVFSSLVAGGILLPFTIITKNIDYSIDYLPLIVTILSSITYLFGIYFYLKALEKNDTSIVVSMFQLIPVFSFILGFIFLKETLSIKQLFGCLIIILSAFAITIDEKHKNNDNKKYALLMMILSSFLSAIYFILFNFAVKHSDYDTVSFFYQIGLLFSGIVLIFIKKYRIPFLRMIKNGRARIFLLNTTNEAINLFANLFVNYANTIIPIALSTTLNGFQPAFVFLIGFIGEKTAPKIFYENISKSTIIQKSICIILGVIGLYIISF